MSTEQFWIGVNDIETEGHYRWVGSGRVLTLSDWERNQPTPGTGDNCGRLEGQNAGQWVNDNCDSMQFYICEERYTIVFV